MRKLPINDSLHILCLAFHLAQFLTSLQMRLHKGQILLQDVLYFSLRDQQREKGKKILPSLEEGWHVVFESGNAKLQLENLFLLTEFSPSLQLIMLMRIYPVLI